MPDEFELLGTRPASLHVRETTANGAKTETFCIVADYDWAEVILCGGCYRDHANGIARVLGAEFDCPVQFALCDSEAPRDEMRRN